MVFEPPYAPLLASIMTFHAYNWEKSDIAGMHVGAYLPYPQMLVAMKLIGSVMGV